MINPDILRVLAELHTFTSDDVAEALEMTRSGANYLISDMYEAKWLERVKSGHSYVYGLTEKARAKLAKLPPVDPEERCLMLVKLADTDRYLYHRGAPVLDTSKDEITWLIQS